MAPRSPVATCLWLALAAAILALAQVLARSRSFAEYPPASSSSDACHAIVAVQAQGGSSAADLEKVTAKTFFEEKKIGGLWVYNFSNATLC
jgi:predicted DsbA family dithiol-disulfide isomerase